MGEGLKQAQFFIPTLTMLRRPSFAHIIKLHRPVAKRYFLGMNRGLLFNWIAKDVYRQITSNSGNPYDNIKNVAGMFYENENRWFAYDNRGGSLLKRIFNDPQEAHFWLLDNSQRQEIECQEESSQFA